MGHEVHLDAIKVQLMNAHIFIVLVVGSCVSFKFIFLYGSARSLSHFLGFHSFLILLTQHFNSILMQLRTSIRRNIYHTVPLELMQLYRNRHVSFLNLKSYATKNIMDIVLIVFSLQTITIKIFFRMY